jgi:hypothetical protein
MTKTKFQKTGFLIDTLYKPLFLLVVICQLFPVSSIQAFKEIILLHPFGPDWKVHANTETHKA